MILRNSQRKKKYTEKEDRMNSRTDQSGLNFEAVVIGTSAGGTNALKVILKSLPRNFALPVIIVQHLHPNSDDYSARILSDSCKMIVKQANEKEKIEPGVVYTAPPNYHLLVEENETFSLSIAEREKYARPSIDVLFETAADVYGEKLIGIILTGANNDGSQGLKRIKEKGGLTIVQDPETAEVDSMPRDAIATTQVDYVLPLERIGPILRKMSQKQKDG
jgi:two-component system chemotaxis response regulator CheB